MSVVQMRCGGRPDVMFVSIVCLFFEGVRIGEARHVYFWGNPNEINSDRNVCHISPRGGVPTQITTIFFPMKTGLAIAI